MTINRSYVIVQLHYMEIAVKYRNFYVEASKWKKQKKDWCFLVDASEAGVGNLEVAVNEGRIPSMAQSLGQHRYDISFVPREQVDHTISVRFNNEPVPGM